MEAHHRTGNLAGVEAVMHELRRTVEVGEPYDSIPPDTVACYERLTRQDRRTGWQEHRGGPVNRRTSQLRWPAPERGFSVAKVQAAS